MNWQGENIPKYCSHTNHDSVIIFKREKLGNINHELMDEFGKSLDFNQDSSFVFTSKKFLILSVHLKSKKDVNVKQAKEMFAFLRGVKSNPEFKDLKIVVGMDANNFLA